MPQLRSVAFQSLQWRLRNLKHRLRSSQQERPGMASPWLTQTLIFVNLIMFTLTVLLALSHSYSIEAIFSPSPQLLVEAGGQWWPLALNENQWWRCITYAYVHGGLIHLLFNMVVLYQVGGHLEQEIPRLGYIGIYTLAVVAATVAGLLWHPRIVVVGASGGLFGLLGFAVGYYHRVGGRAALDLRDFMLKWALLALVIGFFIGADNAAHLGGAVTGILCGLAWPQQRVYRQYIMPLITLGGSLSIAVTLLSLAAVIGHWFSG